MGANPVDEDGNEYEIHHKPQEDPEPEPAPVNKQESSSENPTIS